MKQLSMVLLGLLISDFAYASGAYVGINFGADSSAIKYNLSSGTAANARLNEFESLAGIKGGLYLGYQFSFSSRVLASIEAHYALSNGQFDYSPSNSNMGAYSYIAGPSAGVLFSTGLQLAAGSLVSVNAGWSYAQFERTATVAQAATFGQAFKHYQSGYELGIGHEVALSGPWAIRLEYHHQRYGDIKNNSGNGANTATYKPQADETLLGVSYYFNPQLGSDKDQTPLAMNNFFINAGITRVTTTLDTSAKNGGANEQWPHGLSGFVGDIGVGYSKLLGRFYFGEEFFAHMGKVDMTYKHLRTSRNFQLHNNFGMGFSVFPGYLLNASNVLFARLGWAQSQFEKTGGVNAAAANPIGPNFKKRVNGFESGLGIESALSTSLSLLTEYQYTIYRTISNASGGINFHYEPYDSEFTVGLNYRFR